MPRCSQTVSQDVFILSLMCCKQAIRAASMYSSCYFIYEGIYVECTVLRRTYHVYYKPISLESAVSISMRRKLKREKRMKKKKNVPTKWSSDVHVNIFPPVLLCFCVCVSCFPIRMATAHRSPVAKWTHGVMMLFSLLALWNSVRMNSMKESYSFDRLALQTICDWIHYRVWFGRFFVFWLCLFLTLKQSDNPVSKLIAYQLDIKSNESNQ